MPFSVKLSIIPIISLKPNSSLLTALDEKMAKDTINNQQLDLFFNVPSQTQNASSSLERKIIDYFCFWLPRFGAARTNIRAWGLPRWNMVCHTTSPLEVDFFSQLIDPNQLILKIALSGPILNKDL